MQQTKIKSKNLERIIRNNNIPIDSIKKKGIFNRITTIKGMCPDYSYMLRLSDTRMQCIISPNIEVNKTTIFNVLTSYFMPPEQREHMIEELEQAGDPNGRGIGMEFIIYRRSNPMKRALLTSIPVVAYMLGQFGVYGSRSVDNVYSFQYNGKPASVRHENIRLGIDNYYVLVDGKDKLTGALMSDDGKEIKASRGFYEVRDAREKK